MWALNVSLARRDVARLDLRMLSFDVMKSAAATLVVDLLEGSRFMLEELDQLRCRDSQLQRRAGQVPVVKAQNIQSFRQQRCKVFVVGIAGDSGFMATRTPERRGCCFGHGCRTDFQSQIDPQSLDRHAMIVELTATFRGLTFDSGGKVLNDHCRFGLVPMLPARPATSLVTDLAVAQQQFDGGMHWMLSSVGHLW